MLILKKIVIPLTLLFLSLLGFITILYLDKKFLHIHNFEYGIPNFNFKYLVRSFSIFVCVVIVFYVLTNLKNSEKKNISLFNYSRFLNKWGIISFIVFSLFFIFILIFKPIIFNKLSEEDSIIEWGSALFLFGASIVFLITWRKKHIDFYSFKHFKWLCVLLSVAFFVVAMEEVSWFQRVINFNTPSAFNKNLQHEANLHNFNTNYSENIYYFGSFMFLVLIPYLHLLFPNFITNKYLKFYIPRPLIAVLGAIPCAYNFDRWDALITQFTFFSCVLILWSLRQFFSDQKERKIISLFLILLIFIQIVFLSNNGNYIGIYDVKEYKEFLIPLCFLIYSLDKLNLMNKNELLEN